MRKLIPGLFLLLLTLQVIAQDRTVTGRVTAKEDGLPIPGVSVKLKGATLGTQTGADGRYSLSIPTAVSTLQFSFIGYATQEVATGADNTINVELVVDNNMLGEVVITALGVSREKKALGYSATTVGNEEINRASPVNIIQGLQGKIAGVDISTTSGAPGGSSKVVLRGFSSIAGNNQPLYVIDGVPVNNSRPGGSSPSRSIGDLEENFDFGNAANDINPTDIESVTILKGAGATSLYGSRGTNGVIVITTKKGQAGKFKVDFSSSASFSTVAVVPKFQDKFGQGWDGVDIISENGNWGPAYDGALRPWGAVVNNSQLLRNYSYIKNNYRDAFDLGGEFSNTIALSGGNDASTFNLSYGNVGSNGMMPGDNDSYKRNSLSLRGSTIYKAFTATASVNYVGKNSRFVEVGQGDSGIGANFYEEILQIPGNVPIKELQDYKNLYFNVDNYFTPFAENPYYPLFENGSKFKSDRAYGNVDFKYKVNDLLTFQFQQGGDLTNSADKIWHAKNNPSPGSWNAGANVEGATRQADVGNVVEGSEKYFEYDSKLHALFQKRINTTWDVNGLVGLNYNDRGYRTLYTSVEDLAIGGFYSLSNSANSPESIENDSHRRLFGTYASATLGYKGYAYLTLNARNDWSSTLPKGANSYFYPGANASLVLSDVFDMSSTKISFFKVRASWGQTGSDTSPYRVNNVLNTSIIPVRGGGTTINFPVNGVPGFSIANTLNNDVLRPEISTETEFGTEFRILNNRIGFDLTYYHKINNDQILPIDASPSSGYKFIIVNFGKVRNRGIELAMNASPVKSSGFNWDLGYTFTRNRNTVLELPEGLNQVLIETAYDAKMLAKVGQPLGVFEAPVIKTDPDGHPIVNPTNGLGVAAEGDSYYGSAQRDFTMGLTNSFSYKGFSLGVALDWRKGGVFYSGTANLLNFVGADPKTTYNDRKPFIIPNSVLEITDAAGNVTGYRENDVPVSEDFIDDYYYDSTNKALSYKNNILDKSYLKLRDVTLSYALPKSVAGKLRADAASITVFGKNLMTWLPKGNRSIDPELSNYGNDLSSEFGEFRTGPSTRFFGASLKVTF
jgi:TonB-linked SusC/RagA family outer membrane protein